MKKILPSIISTALLFSLALPTFAEANSFADIEGSYAKDAIIQLQKEGILDGTDAEHFNPKGELTRAQFVAIMVKSLKLPIDNSAVSTFSDVEGWAIPYIQAAYKYGIIDGMGNGTFSPNAVLTREQSATIMVKALQKQGKIDETATLTFTDKDSISDWAKNYVALALRYHLISGMPDGSFNPRGNATREQAAVMGANFIKGVEEVITINNPKPESTPTSSPATPVPTTTPTPSTGGGGGGEYIPPVVIPPVVIPPVVIPPVVIPPVVAPPVVAPDVTAITTAITAANAAKLGVVISVDGSDVPKTSKWVTQAVNDTLVAAITTATTAQTTATTAIQVTNAAAALDAAVETYSAAKSNGTKQVVESPETILSNPTLTVYAPNADREWDYETTTYEPNTVFQVNVNLVDHQNDYFKSAEVSLYNGDTLLATHKAKQPLFDAKYAGFSDVFAIGDQASDADSNWAIGAYDSNSKPTNVKFTLTDHDGVLHIVNAPISTVQLPVASVNLLSNPTLTIFAPNLDKEWTYLEKTYLPNTVFQVNVNLVSGTNSDFKSAVINLYDGETLLATDIAKEALFSPNYTGLSDVFAIGDSASTADDSWYIGGYSSNKIPTRVEFQLVDNTGSLHKVEAPITTVQPTIATPESLLSNPTLTVYAPNVGKPWKDDGGVTYPANTVFQANVNFDSVTMLSDFDSAVVSLYNGQTLLSTNIAKKLLLSGSDHGLTGFFAIGDASNVTADPSWYIGGYSSTQQPTRAIFKLIDKNGAAHIVEASMAPISVE